MSALSAVVIQDLVCIVRFIHLNHKEHLEQLDGYVLSAAEVIHHIQ